ncbi:MAG: hypothetical protein M1611_00795 [Candidatus Marsarchaeota archaeon]|nr:hypothetical protein [Candidatus Marsarchaeota archaeon]
MISNASRENRQELLRRLHRGMENLKAKREVEGIAREVHKSMHLQEPDAQDIGRYLRAVKSGAEGSITSKIRTAAAQPYVDSILEVRTKPLPRRFKREDEDVAATIENIMVQKPFVEGTAAKEFYSGNRTVAKSVSRLLALHYEEEGGKRGLTLRLRSILPYLSAHLQAETLMAVENKFAKAGQNLPKHSIFEIHETLERLQKHNEEIVCANAKTILTTALRNGNLSLADTLAEGAQEKYDELTKHKEIVRANARSIISAALNKGNLSLADKFADEISKNPDNAREILRNYFSFNGE